MTFTEPAVDLSEASTTELRDQLQRLISHMNETLTAQEQRIEALEARVTALESP